MKIIAVGNRNSAVSYHRLFMPLSFMKKDFAFFTDVLNDEVLKDGFDILLINRFIQGVELEDVLAYKKKYGFKLVVDIDDYWHLDPYHILYGNYPYKKVMDHIRAADLVTCTNEDLLQEIRQLNEKVHIVPNALPFGLDQFTDLHIPSEDDRVRFVYAGSVTHEKDVAQLKNPMKRVATDPYVSDKVHFCICGYEPDNKATHPIWHRMIHDFLYGFKVPGYVKESLSVEYYMNFYNEADVSIVPLAHTRFNSMKSNLKVLEAACKKIPVIASCVKPYSECLYIHPIHSQTDWYNAIKKMATDAIYRKELGEANHQWCVDQFSLDKVNEKRHQLFKSLL
jgi:glycosyltransferase involved in cell wall biosynthesis